MNIGRGQLNGVSVAHILLGILMAVCGGLQSKLQLKYLWFDSLYAGIWVGIWMMLTAIMGIFASFTRTPVQPYTAGGNNNTTGGNNNTAGGNNNTAGGNNNTAGGNNNTAGGNNNTAGGNNNTAGGNNNTAGDNNNTAGIIKIIVFIIFSTISSTLGLEIVVYYIYTFATSWDVYQSSSSYKNIAFVTLFLAIVEVIIGLVAATFGYLFSFHEGHERTGRGLRQTQVGPMNAEGEGNEGGTKEQRNPQPMNQLNSPRQYVARTRTVYKHISDGREWGLERDNTDGRIYYYNIERGERRADLPPIPLPRAPKGYRIENIEFLRDEYHDKEWLSLNGNGERGGERGGYCQVTKGENRVTILPQDGLKHVAGVND